MEFQYFYGSQADQFSFIRIPKMMLTEDTFSELSIPAVWGTSGSDEPVPEERLV